MSMSRYQPVAASRRAGISLGALRAQRKFLRFFPKGFADQNYIEWERGYKWRAHQEWTETLGPNHFRALMRSKDFQEIAVRAVRIESRTNLLFSFEKMALRDAVKPSAGARAFGEGLFEFLHGAGALRRRFEDWRDVVGALPRRQTRVLTWPILTVFGFIAQPERHIFLKPTVTKSPKDMIDIQSFLWVQGSSEYEE